MRTRRKEKGCGQIPKRDPKSKGGGNKFPDTSATPSVIDFSTPISLVRKIYVLDRENLRHLRGGVGLCSPGIIEPALEHANLSGRL